MPEFVSSSPPDLASITEAITNAVPDITEIANAVPSVAEIANAVPDIEAITNAVPVVEHWTSSSILCVPDAGAAAITLTAGNAAYGAWVQLLASIGASDAVLVGVSVDCGVSGNDYPRANIRIGIGGAGSEVAIASFRLGRLNRPIGGMYLPVSIPILIPSGSRVSASYAASSAGGLVDIGIEYIVLPL